MTFIIIDSKLTFDKNFLNIKKVKYDPTKRYWLDSFFLLTFYILFQTYRAVYEKPRAWVLVVIGLIWIYPHLERLCKILFLYKWGTRIRLNEITEIKILPIDNELETTLLLKLTSGRQKLLIFRTAENQLTEFVEILQEKVGLLNSANVYS